MKIEIEMWQLFSLAVSLVGFVIGFGKVLLDQTEKRQSERAAAQEAAREAGLKVLRDSLQEHLIDERRNAQAMQELERNFLKWQAELPVHYVRREDYVRGQSVIEAKLDALYSKLELVQIKGAKND